MRKSKWIAAIAGAVAIALGGAGLAVGDYVYTSGTKVPCAVNQDALDNFPDNFRTATYNSGPFRGSGWNKWVQHDLSNWWLVGVPFEEQKIEVASGIELSAWWIHAEDPRNKKTVIVTHGIGASKKGYNTLLPTSMLVKSGLNVLLVDMRDSGESTCTDGRHSAGQEESSDLAVIADYLVSEKRVPVGSIGMFGVSGGAIATSLLPAKTDKVSAFAMEGTIFDFNAAATKEVEYQGFPGFLWQLAIASAQLLHGVNLVETDVKDSIQKAGSRPMLILHGDNDQRLEYQSSVDFYEYAKSVGVDISLERFEGADHTEGMLLETDRYASLLGDFFIQNLK
ncbi:MAG: alpha/beta hydrolase [Aquiluna sp.]|nr:alpha/beta hydrolase [Aquiluna sp.]MCF8545631.1 alpha/beta hydrolase [Aquiluna sp.]